MKKGKITTNKRKLTIAKKICEMYAKGEHTIDECLLKHNIKSRATWTNWRNSLEQVEQMYQISKVEHEKAFQVKRDAHLKKLAHIGLEKSLTGYTVEETKTVIVPSEPKKDKDGNIVEVGKAYVMRKEVKERYIPPNQVLIQVVLYNKDPENFKDMRNVKVEGGMGMTLDVNYQGMSPLNQSLEASPYELSGEWEKHDKWLELTNGGKDIEEINYEEIEAIEPKKKKSNRRKNIKE